MVKIHESYVYNKEQAALSKAGVVEWYRAALEASLLTLTLTLENLSS